MLIWNSMENEGELVEEAKTDPDAFGKLYDRHYQPIFGFLLRRTGNVQVAQDLTSETFFHALKSIHRYKQRGKPFKSWLFAIAVAQVGNYYRSRKKVLQVTTNDCPELVANEEFRADFDLIEGEKAAERKGLARILKRHIRKLNDKQQNILALRFESRMTIPEIGRVMNMKEGTVKSHIHRALKKLNVLMNPRDARDDGYEQQRTTEPAGALGAARG
jgi:RNA polymerase sigma-70 factor (ECF subfamily)